MIVFVIDNENHPLLPTHSARARKLLKKGKAKILSVVPFTIKLNRSVEKRVGTFEVGIDDGSKHVGIAVKNLSTNKVVFRGQIELRQDVKRLMKQRKEYRRSRRSRNLRYRKPRWSNRIKSKIVPSIKCRKDSTIRFIKDMSKRININKIIVEEVKFNHAKYKWGKYFSLVEIGKSYLKEQILNLGLVYESTFGYITKENRLKLGLSKRHSNDACAIIKSNNIMDREYFIKPKRTKIWKNNPTKIYEEKKGFKHYDLVKATRNHKSYIGLVKSLKSKYYISLRTSKDDNFLVSYSKTKLLQRFNGIVYYY